MKERNLGDGLTVSCLGVGCMPMTGMADRSATYGEVDPAEAIATLDEAIERGVTFFDTAELYGATANEAFLGEQLGHRAKRLVIATKFGFVTDERGEIQGIDCSPKRAREACEGSLRRLKADAIDLYYQHRIDPTIPIEETIGGMADLVSEGKIKHIGLCEVTPETLRRAHATHPIAALQSEYSLWERQVENTVLATCSELDVGFVPYSPLGRGFLAGNVQSAASIPADDHRRTDPRFDEESFDRNLAIVSEIRELATGLGASPAQVALAWLLSRSERIVPIPGFKRRVTLRDSLAAADLKLPGDVLARIDELLPPGSAAGSRVRENRQALLSTR